MSELEIIELLTGNFYENFADQAALCVREGEAVGVLYGLVTGDNVRFSRAVQHKILFRGAYVLERIYFDYPQLFSPFVEPFCQCDFASCEDPSARRHFTKIMAHLLNIYSVDNAALKRIAEAAGEWALDPKARVAVRIGAVEVLSRCRSHIDWVDDSWEDLIAAMSNDATPAICARLRNGWRRDRL